MMIAPNSHARKEGKRKDVKEEGGGEEAVWKNLRGGGGGLFIIYCVIIHDAIIESHGAKRL